MWNGQPQALGDIQEGIVRISVRGQVVTDQLEAGGLPIDSTVTLAHIRELMDLYSIGRLEDLERLCFYKNDCKVSGQGTRRIYAVTFSLKYSYISIYFFSL